MAIHKKTVVSVVFVLILAGVALLPLVADPSPQGPEAAATRNPREIVLVARQMSFYLASDPRTPNPMLRVAPGEQVRVVLRNEDPGIKHGFAVSAWRIATETLQSEQVGSVKFRVPAQPGRYSYTCTPHAKMMTGILEVKN